VSGPFQPLRVSGEREPRRGRMAPALLLTAFLILAGGPWAAAQDKTEDKNDSVGAFIDSRSFFINLELSGEATKYREGRTIFGEFLTVGAVYKSSSHIRLAAGAFLGRTFGDGDDELEEAEFYGQFRYQPNQRFSLTFGNLDLDGHAFLDALFDDTLRYEERPTETGFEVFGAWRWLSGRAWINWQAINTEAQREKFDVGTLAKAQVGWTSLQAQFHWIHRGGQLFSAGEPVSDDLSLALGGELNLPLPWLERAGLQAFWLHSHVIPDRAEEETLTGDGVLVGLFAEKWGFRLWGNAWVGKDFLTEDGDPFYRAPNHWTFGLTKVWWLTDWAAITAQVDGLVLDGSVYINEWLMVSLTPEILREIKPPWRTSPKD